MKKYMITVSYGLHYRRKNEKLVAEMMEELAKLPYRNLDFLSLKGKSWEYLGKNTNGFVFDVHGGLKTMKVLNSEIPTAPETTFIVSSPKTESSFISFLKNYRNSSIFLVYKNELMRFENSAWRNYEIRSPNPRIKRYALKRLRKCNLQHRLIGVELLNAFEKWQIENCHKPFIKKFLKRFEFDRNYY